MNERLTEIYRQCRSQEALASQDQYASANVLLADEVEKFAELIVRECAEVADNADATRSKWESVGKYVREHFGVE